MNAKRPLSAGVLLLTVVGGMQIAGIQTAAADAGSHASCLGIEASSISPPGSTDEFPGGMPEAIAFVRGLAVQSGMSPGAILSSVAHLHAGSHQACDEATE